MALGGKMDHRVGLLSLKNGVNRPPVTDIGLEKLEIGVLHGPLQGGEVACVGQLIHAQEGILRVSGQHMVDKIGANKPGSAGDKDFHGISPKKNTSLRGGAKPRRGNPVDF